jgi:hypothetical protein
MSAIAGAITAVAELVSVDPARLTIDDQLEGLEHLLVLDNQIQAVKARWVRAVHDSDATVTLCGRQTKGFLVEWAHREPGEAGALLRLARGLRHATLTDDALRAGDMTSSHALLILKVLKHIKDDDLRETVERELVKLALDAPPFLVARAVDQILVLLGVEKSSQDAHERRFGQRGVGLDETLGGTGSLNGTLTPLLREKLALYLASKAQKAGPEDDRTQRQRNHDALEELVDAGLEHMDDLPPVGGERPRVVVHIDYRHLAGLVEAHAAVATLGSGTDISAQTARRLACDAQILPVVLGGNSEVLDIGSASRHPTTAITRATYIRDGGRCTFPGCTNRRLRQHHMKFWSQWHQTSYDVMAWVCSFHHWLVHEGGWSMRRERGRIYVWTSPIGLEVRTSPPRQPEAA